MIIWIVLYCVLQSLANPLNKMIGIESSASAIFCIIQTVILFGLMKKNCMDFVKLLFPSDGYFGFVEEVIFRGFLFKAIAKDNVKKAVIISSVTFGLGHLLNLINGSYAELTENLFQIVGAISIGFLSVMIFYRGRILLLCIISHSVINVSCTFANETGLTVEKRIAFNLMMFLITAVYALTLTKTLPKHPYFERNDEAEK